MIREDNHFKTWASLLTWRKALLLPYLERLHTINIIALGHIKINKIKSPTSQLGLNQLNQFTTTETVLVHLNISNIHVI